MNGAEARGTEGNDADQIEKQIVLDVHVLLRPLDLQGCHFFIFGDGFVPDDHKDAQDEDIATGVGGYSLLGGLLMLHGLLEFYLNNYKL